MNEKDALIAQALDNLVAAVEKLNRKNMQLEGFIIDNFKGYHPFYTGDVHREVMLAKKYIDSLRLTTATNADNKHLLDKEEEVKKPEQSTGYRVSPYATSYMMPDVEIPDIIGPPARPYSLEHRDLNPDADF